MKAVPESEPVMCGHLWVVPEFGGAARGAVELPVGGAGAALVVAAGADVPAATLADVPSAAAPIAPPASVPSAVPTMTPLRSLPMQ